MSYVLPFIAKRQIGSNGYKLNCNFLLERFVCKERDVFSVPGSVCCVPPFACQFRKDHSSGDTPILAVASEEGAIMLLNSSDSSKEILAHNWIAHNNAIFDICWLPDSPKIISSSGDHTAILWDTVTCNRICTFAGHSGSVKCIDICPEHSCIFATGSRDGTVNIWDTRVQKYINCDSLMKPEITITSYVDNKCKTRSFPNKKWKSAASTCVSKSVTSVAFQDTNHLVSADCGETAVKIWDLRRTYCQKLKMKPNPKYTISYKNTTKYHGSISMIFDSTRKKLYVCCTDDTIYTLDCHSYSNACVPAFYGFRAQTYFVKLALSHDNQFLLSGSSDEKAYIWNVSQPGPPLVSLAGHSAEVTAVAWHPQKLMTLATCGDDNKVLIWRMDGENPISREEKYVGYSKPVCDVNKVPENAILKNTNDFDRSHIPTRKVHSSLKEYSLMHFVSHLNSCTPHGFSSSSSIEAKVQPKKFKLVQETHNLICNESIFKTLPCYNKNTEPSIQSSSVSFSSIGIHGKENLVRSNPELILNETKHQTSSKKKKLNLKGKDCNKTKSKSPFKDSSMNKKRKCNIQENLITCYFQEPSLSKIN